MFVHCWNNNSVWHWDLLERKQMCTEWTKTKNKTKKTKIEQTLVSICLQRKMKWSEQANRKQIER